MAHKPATAKNQILPEQHAAIFKRSLGAKPETGLWDADRREKFELLAAQTNRRVSQSKKTVIDTLPTDPLSKIKREALKAKEEFRRMRDLQTQPSAFTAAPIANQAAATGANASPPAAAPRTEHRLIMIKEEDHLFQTLEYRGVFNRKSAVITGRTPLVKDAELDYDLEPEEEFEELAGEDIGSKESGEEDEESDEVDLMDGFVVPDEGEDSQGQAGKQPLRRKEGAEEEGLRKALLHQLRGRSGGLRSRHRRGGPGDDRNQLLQPLPPTSRPVPGRRRAAERRHLARAGQRSALRDFQEPHHGPVLREVAANHSGTSPSVGQNSRPSSIRSCRSESSLTPKSTQLV